tara:strand:- start:175 stop:453 length:279 start_codon:yes stop_codon:yes gene_type:complete
MKLKKLLEINQMCEERKAPFDIQESFEYESSKGKNINILDMDIVHFVRAFKVLARDKKTLKQELGRKSDKELYWISNRLNGLAKELTEYIDV